MNIRSDFYEFAQDKEGGSKTNFGDGNIDPAFRKIRKNLIGFHIWKTENNRVEAVQRDKYGVFYDDCTYIIYAANTKGCVVNQNTISREVRPNSLPMHSFIHFWLGAKTTTERSGNIAYKVIELDNHLGNVSAQYRETQEHESIRFASYFKEGITVYTHDEANTSGQLFHVKNKKSPICVQRTPINWSHFKSGYVMILKTSKFIFIWFGRTSTATERLNAYNFAARMKKASNRPLEISTIDDGYEQSINDICKKDWNQYLCLSQRSVHPTDVIPVPSETVFRLYKCGFTNNKYRIEEIKSKALMQSDLDDNAHAFIIDGGLAFGVWIWVGRYTELKDKAEAMRNCRGFVKKKNYPSSTAVVRVIDGSEPPEFTRLFTNWIAAESNAVKTASLSEKFDAVILMQRPQLAAEYQLIDDGTGDMSIYRVTNNCDIVEITKRKNISLFSSDCYIIHYILTIPENNLKNAASTTTKHILYLWTGKHCPMDVRKHGEELSHEFSIHLRKTAVELRIVENHEPPHFLQMFRGRLIIFKGSCTDYDASGNSISHPNTYILKVFGNANYNAKAIQISTKSNEFRSKDCYIIKAGDATIWIWCGHGSTGDNREVAKSIGSLLGEYNLAVEGNEPNELWQYIPDSIKKKLQNVGKMENGVDILSPERTVVVPKSKVELHVCFIMNDAYLTKQIFAFNQEDLAPEDIYILDGQSFIYLWIGSLSPKYEKSKCWSIIKQYLKNYPLPRDTEIPKCIVYSGLEPVTFTGYFDQWNPRLWDNHKTYENLTMEAAVDGQQVVPAPRMLKRSEEDDSDFDRYPKYPIDLLRNEASLLPDAVDPKKKEMHLTHDDFVSIFKTNYVEFAQLPNWKQQELKKLHRLF